MSFLTTPRSQYSLWIQWPILMCLSLLTGLAGLYMYAYYAGCDPLTAKRIEKADQLLPLMVVDTMSQYPGIQSKPRINCFTLLFECSYVKLLLTLTQKVLYETHEGVVHK